MINKNVCQNIRRLREGAGFTQGKLAQYMGVDQSLVSKIEKGERGLSVDALEKLATLFGVTTDQIEAGPVPESRLAIAFRGSDMSMEEMGAVAAINQIALNSEFLSILLGGEDKW